MREKREILCAFVSSWKESYLGGGGVTTALSLSQGWASPFQNSPQQWDATVWDSPCGRETERESGVRVKRERKRGRGREGGSGSKDCGGSSQCCILQWC